MIIGITISIIYFLVRINYIKEKNLKKAFKKEYNDITKF